MNRTTYLSNSIETIAHARCHRSHDEPVSPVSPRWPNSVSIVHLLSEIPWQYLLWGLLDPGSYGRVPSITIAISCPRLLHRPILIRW